MQRLLTDRDLYHVVVEGLILTSRRRVWIATADLKDLYVIQTGRSGPLLEELARLVRRRVEIRLLHAKRPGPRFWQDYNRFPELDEGMEMTLCPRVHTKMVIADGHRAYFGSANLTGAGLGAKSPLRRNFETGLVTDDPGLVADLVEQFDAIWRGQFCGPCRRKAFCTAHVDLHPASATDASHHPRDL